MSKFLVRSAVFLFSIMAVNLAHAGTPSCNNYGGNLEK